MNIKQGYFFFFPAALIAVALRTLLLLFMIEPKNGFIKEEYTLFAIGIFAIIIIACALVFIFSYFSKSQFSKTLPKSISFKVISLVLAVIILYDTLASTIDYSFYSWQRSLELVTAVVAAASIISFVITDLLGIEFPKIFSVLPIGFWFVRLIIIFMSYSTLANISDNIFELASLCLTLVSFLQIAKLICLEENENTHAFTFGLLLTASLVCLVTSVPRAIVAASGNTDILHINNLPIMTTLATGLYLLIFAINSFKTKE